MSQLLAYGIAPKMRPIAPGRSDILSILDIGSSKIVCLVARLIPVEAGEALKKRTHTIEVIGIGHQRSRGLKGGAVVDMEAAETAIRQAVDAAERMAKVHIEAVVVNITGGRPASDHLSAVQPISQREVTSNDVSKVLELASQHARKMDRIVVHALPVGYSIDGTRGIDDPTGMMASSLGAEMHVVSSDVAAVRNLMLAIERCHLGVEAIVSTPLASGLAVLADDEAELGTTVVDLGGGTTSLGIFVGGHLVHADAVAIGGQHITMDVARGLSTRLSDAERLKTLYGGCIATASDDRETVAVSALSDDERDMPAHLPKSQLIRIIRPRVEEILELVRDRLKAAGKSGDMTKRIVLTGGTCQLTGLQDIARRILGGHVRIGRPLGVSKLPEAARGPAFAAAAGLLIYPQIAGAEYFEPSRRGRRYASASDGYFSRVGRWLRESF
jgi:cell division protein FtsA